MLASPTMHGAGRGIATASIRHLRLHLLSARLVRPRELNVEGIFSQLGLVAWTELGAVHPADLDELRTRRRLSGKNLTVHGIDKFPQND